MTPLEPSADSRAGGDPHHRTTPLPHRATVVLESLPAGTQTLAARLLADGLAAAGRPVGRHPWLDPTSVAAQIVRPLLDTDDWPGPSQPLAVGAGYVHADLIDDDHELLARLRTILVADGPPDPETLAAAAQEWRLPVTPYRPLLPGPCPTHPATARAPGLAVPAPRVGTEPLGAGPDGPGWDREPLVVDLSSLWAGPLCTGLLAGLGAHVVKIDPACRPDGFGVHPHLYTSLNGAKEIIDLDLRRPPDRRRFESLVARADLVVDSFSRRVMPNFGYDPEQLRALKPGLATLSLVAFPAECGARDWVSYGPGVHAMSGLADRGPDGIGPRFRPADIAYPDALAGLAAFAAAATELARPAGRRSHIEVSLAAALAPLVEEARGRRGPGNHDG